MPPLSPFQRSCIAFAISQSPVLSTQAATITVNSVDDTIAKDGQCTLREAILNANNDDDGGGNNCDSGTIGSDTIEFNLDSTSEIIKLSSTLPTISTPISINGPGQNVLTL